MNYYNEFDHSAAEWLRELIADGSIPPGDVDERSITDVTATDLLGYTQCHFFAGIGGWSLALRLAGWPDNRPVWTGSCPCQCFSTAGKQRGFADERDLWPVFADLIRQCRPECVFGEQVENAIRHGWLDRVYADMEREGYAVGAHVLGAHSVGAPHRRYRLYWGAVSVADNASEQYERSGEPGENRSSKLANGYGNGGMADGANDGRNERMQGAEGSVGQGECRGLRESAGKSDDGGVDDTEGIGRRICDAANVGAADREVNALADASGRGCGVANGNGERQQERCISISMAPDEQRESEAIGAELRSLSGLPPWSNSRFIYCRDGKVRRIPAESLLLRMADGLSGDVDGIGVAGISEVGGFPLTTKKEGRAMLLKGYGNAIVPEVASEFIGAFMETQS